MKTGDILLPLDPLASPAEPASVEEARLEIAATRLRMAATLDAIEARVDEKKEEIRDRIDVLRPLRDRIRERPWHVLALVAAAGLLLGYLTADADDEPDEEELALQRELELEHLARRIELRVNSPEYLRPRRRRSRTD